MEQAPQANGHGTRMLEFGHSQTQGLNFRWFWGARSWTQWSSWISLNSGWSMILWLCEQLLKHFFFIISNDHTVCLESDIMSTGSFGNPLSMPGRKKTCHWTCNENAQIYKELNKVYFLYSILLPSAIKQLLQNLGVKGSFRSSKQTSPSSPFYLV